MTPRSPTGPILVGYDGSDEARDALALAKAIASASRSRLLLAWIEPVGPLDIPVETIVAPIQDRAEEALDEVARSLRAQEFEVSTRVGLLGAVHRGIQELAEDEMAALIVVGSSHRGRTGRVMAGTVGTRLLRGSPCPVAIAPRGLAQREEVSLERIGLAYDGSPEAQVALEEARYLAHATQATLEVIAVSDSAHEWLCEARDALHGEFTVVTKAVAGEAGPELMKIGEQLDLLVLGSRGYGPFRRVLLGSVASHLIERCRCPLVVTPRGSRIGVAAPGGQAPAITT